MQVINEDFIKIFYVNFLENGTFFLLISYNSLLYREKWLWKTVSSQVTLNGTEAKDNREDFGSAGSDGCVHRVFRLVLSPLVDGRQPQRLDGCHHQRSAF